MRPTPSSALGSSRQKLKDEHFAPILKQLKKYDIRYFFMIGGNDTMDTIHRVTELRRRHGHEMIGVGVPKTVDNDLFGIDHTPGYPERRPLRRAQRAAGGPARPRHAAGRSVHDLPDRRPQRRLAARGRGAGRTQAERPRRTSSCCPSGRSSRRQFLAAVAEAHKKHGFVSIVCGEGITNADGTPVSASQTKDKFGNVEFGAMGGTSAAMMLHRMISNAFGWRGEFQVTESLQMCAADRGVKLDFDEAYACGRKAVKLAGARHRGRDGHDRAREQAGRAVPQRFGTIPLSEVAITPGRCPTSTSPRTASASRRRSSITPPRSSASCRRMRPSPPNEQAVRSTSRIALNER